MNFASGRGGEIVGRIESLVMSCKLEKFIVEAYPDDVLTMLSTTSLSRGSELSRWVEAEARAAESSNSSLDRAYPTGRFSSASAIGAIRDPAVRR